MSKCSTTDMSVHSVGALQIFLLTSLNREAQQLPWLLCGPEAFAQGLMGQTNTPILSPLLPQSLLSTLILNPWKSSRFQSYIRMLIY